MSASRTSPARRVLACLDGSGLGERSLPHAVAVASALGASLTLLRVLESATGEAAPADPLAWEIRRREAREYLGRLAPRFEKAEVICELIEGRPADEICRWSADHEDVDLTVVTSHGAGGPTPWALSSTARKLLERAPGSFLIIPAAAEPREHPLRYRRLLLPLDGSPQAEIALPVAERLGEAHDSELLLAHVVPVPELTQIGPLAAEDLELSERLRRRNERVGGAYLDRLRARIAAEGRQVRAILLQGGDVASRLAGLASREQVDLVVVAAHGRSARLNMGCGSVTAELIARSPAPLLVVRPRTLKAMQRSPAPGLEQAAARLPQHASS